MAQVPFDSLSDSAQGIIFEVKERLDDLFDSEDGGPHLHDESSRFDDDRYALLLKHAINKVNGASNVASAGFSMANFPWTQPVASSCLTLALLITVIQHFIISYTEQASAEGMDSSPYLSRNGYTDRWKPVLDMLEKEFDLQMSALDRAQASGGIQMLVWSNSFPLGYSQRVRPLMPPWVR